MNTTIEIEVNADWVEFLTQHSDIFFTNYCGYWMYGMEQDSKLGWLCYVHDEEKSIRQVAEHPEYASIVKAWRNGEALPDRWKRLNEQVAIQAYAEGVKRKGMDWYEDGDAIDYDVAIQSAMFGEVIYG